jgi:hypothetical protein
MGGIPTQIGEGIQRKSSSLKGLRWNYEKTDYLQFGLNCVLRAAAWAGRSWAVGCLVGLESISRESTMKLRQIEGAMSACDDHKMN